MSYTIQAQCLDTIQYPANTIQYKPGFYEVNSCDVGISSINKLIQLFPQDVDVGWRSLFAKQCFHILGKFLYLITM